MNNVITVKIEDKKSFFDNVLKRGEDIVPDGVSEDNEFMGLLFHNLPRYERCNVGHEGAIIYFCVEHSTSNSNFSTHILCTPAWGGTVIKT